MSPTRCGCPDPSDAQHCLLLQDFPGGFYGDDDASRDEFCECHCHREEILSECDRCGAPSENLTRTSDCDPEVGYHSTILVCDDCLASKRGVCGSCG